MHLVGRRYDTAAPVRCTLAGGRIAAIEPIDAAPPAELPWLAPGLVDAQVNGYRGVSFNDVALQPEGLARVSAEMAAGGVTSFFPTLTTDSAEVFTAALAAIHRACLAGADAAARVAGIHLEGPYISPEDGPRGAHPRIHCRAPNWAEFEAFQRAAGGRVRLMTLSPEYDAAPEFVRRAAAAGVVIAIGHTRAASSQIAGAIEAGASLSTHLGNGAHALIQRHPNYIWDQLADDRLTASLIADGHHLPPAVVKAMVRAKGVERIFLVSDATCLAGMPPGVYDSPGLGKVELLSEGRLVPAGSPQYLAGAALPLAVGVANVMRFAGASLAEAIRMASITPAAKLGLPAVGLQPSGAADLVQFTLVDGGALNVLATLCAGRVAFGAPVS